MPNDTGRRLSRFLDEYYNALRGYANTIAGQDGGDLLHTCLEQWYESQAVQGHLTRGDKFFLFYCKSALRMSYNSVNSRFHYVHRHRVNPKHVNYEVGELSHNPTANIELRDIEDKLKAIDWFDREVFKLYVSGMGIQELSEETEIPYNTIKRSIERTRRHLEE